MEKGRLADVLSETKGCVLDVSDPVSDIQSVAVPGKADRLANLNGKTICEVLNGPGWRGEETFPRIEESLKRQFSDIKFVPYTEFPPYGKSKPASGITLFPKPGEITPVIQEKGCDAVILGNGG